VKKATSAPDRNLSYRSTRQHQEILRTKQIQQHSTWVTDNSIDPVLWRTISVNSKLNWTRSIWKMLGPFATASCRTPLFYIAIHQVSLLSHATCAIDVHNNDDDNDNTWQRGPLWPHRMGPMRAFSEIKKTDLRCQCKLHILQCSQCIVQLLLQYKCVAMSLLGARQRTWSWQPCDTSLWLSDTCWHCHVHVWFHDTMATWRNATTQNEH